MSISLSIHARYHLSGLSLTGEELESMEQWLGAWQRADSLRTLDGLHGFLTCVALSEADADRERWLAVACPHPAGERPSGETDARAAFQVRLVLLLLDDILLSLADPDRTFSPLAARAGEGAAGCDGGGWCRGFLLGMAVFGEHWSDFLARPELAGLLLPMFLLGRTPPAPGWEDLVRTAAQRRRLTEWIPAVVEAIHFQRFALELLALREDRAARGSPGRLLH